GPGAFRGGDGGDIAFAIRGCESLSGFVKNYCAEVPAQGVGGGSPGGASTLQPIHNTNLASLLEHGLCPTADNLVGDQPVTRSNVTNLVVRQGDVVHITSGGGGGLGDPLLREPSRVAGDVRAGRITQEHARAAFAVAIEANGS